MRQWVIKITEYADRLVEDLDILKDWPESFKEAERNWIGKSEGSEIDFKIDGMDKKFTVFTTRADTLFGATYTVLSPFKLYLSGFPKLGLFLILIICFSILS